MENLENIQNIAEPAESLEHHDETTAPAGEAAAPADGDPEIARLIAEAEQRGYLRGRNEQIEATMMEQPDTAGSPQRDASEDSCPGFLSHIRPDFWD